MHIWREVTGGGRPVDYLNWLAAMWEQWRGTAGANAETYMLRYADHRTATRLMREEFAIWMHAKFLPL